MALTPRCAIVLCFYLFTMLGTGLVSFKSSGLLPNLNFVELAQYHYLFGSPRAAIGGINIVPFGTIFVSGFFVPGFLLAGLQGIDQQLRKVAKIDGIAMWRNYWSIIIPALRPTITAASFKK